MINERVTITVFTPTYNRSNTLNRVYESLTKQTYNNFEWVIVDDGSTDNTKELVKTFCENADFPITYCYQQNAGKHNAINKGVTLAKGDMFIIADSDDSFIPESLETFVNCWNQIEESKKESIAGITCRCIDENGQLIGKNPIPNPYLDANELEAKFIYKFNYEMWGMIKLDILKEYPFPSVSGLRFYPECVIWNKIARKYRMRYVNYGLRLYYVDQENATTHDKSSTRAKENYYLWLHYINDIFDYFKYDKKLFLKAFIGITRDGFLSGRNLSEIIKDVNSWYKKIFVLFGSCIGRLLACR